MKYKYLVSLNKNPNGPHFKRPMVDVEIFGSTTNIKTIALLDSGADYCLFNLEFAKAIGIDINKCQKGQTIGVEGGLKDVINKILLKESAQILWKEVEDLFDLPTPQTLKSPDRFIRKLTREKEIRTIKEEF